MSWLALIPVAWWASGVASFVYWWTYDFDLTRKDLAVGLFCGLLSGPILFLWNWCWHGAEPWKPTTLHEPHTLMRQRIPKALR